MKTGIWITVLITSGCIAGCGGGGGGGGSSAPPGPPTLVWAPNHEKGVNSAGGGYQILITGQSSINVPYVSGPAAPTSLVLTTLAKGTYTVSVRAFAALDASGGTTVSFSAPSASIVVNVP